MKKQLSLFILIVIALITACTTPSQNQIPNTNPPTVPATLIPPTQPVLNSLPATAIPPTPSSIPATATILPTPAGPTQTTAPQRVQFVKVPAPSLANNMLGEKAERQAIVYLPPSYFTSDKRYPVIYYLPGFEESYLGVKLPDDVDKLIQEGKIQEMIIVTPDGKNVLGGSFYVNSPVTGNWEDFLTKDLISYLDSNYRTIEDVNNRAISGFSMGGFGALNLAMKHPDLYSSVYSMSPGLFDENGLAESLLFNDPNLPNQYLESADKLADMDIKDAIQEMVSDPQVFTFAYGEAFSPDPNGKPPYIKYPYSLVDGKLVKDDAVWKQWDSGFGNLKEKVAQYKSNLSKLKGIGLNYGTNDEFTYIPKGSTYFADQLKAAGIPIDVTTYVGGHAGLMNDRVSKGMLPFLSERLGK